MKIEPGQRVELNEGDTIRVGGSTRVYRLHWISFGRAYDTENSFVSASHLKMIDEKDEESAAVEEENEVKLSQDETLVAAEMKHDEYNNSSSVRVKEEERDQDINPASPGNGETQSLESIMMDIASLYSNEKGSILKKEIALSPPSITESMSLSYYDAREEVESPSIDDQEENETSSHKTLWGGISETESQQCNKDRQRPEYHSMKVVPEGVNSDSLFTAKETLSLSATEETGTLVLLGKDPEPVNLNLLVLDKGMAKGKEIQLPFQHAEDLFPEVTKGAWKKDNGKKYALAKLSYSNIIRMAEVSRTVDLDLSINGIKNSIMQLSEENCSEDLRTSCRSILVILYGVIEAIRFKPFRNLVIYNTHKQYNRMMRGMPVDFFPVHPRLILSENSKHLDVELLVRKWSHMSLLLLEVIFESEDEEINELMDVCHKISEDNEVHPTMAVFEITKKTLPLLDVLHYLH